MYNIYPCVNGRVNVERKHVFQYARLTEIVGGNDLGVGIFIGAHQSIGFKVDGQRLFCDLLIDWID